MTNSKELFHDLVNKITLPDSPSEIQSIVYLLLEKTGGITRTDILSEKKITLKYEDVESYINRINQHEPVQYILGEADFYGRVFKVTPYTLIPRPETELLIQEIKHAYSSKSNLHVLDIGTGSGCIAITLALELNQANVTALDISPDALVCAKNNATALHATVHFIQADVLNENISAPYDIIVSNPPYISQPEKQHMRTNVLKYEPHLALFPPGNDPLLFYRIITQKAQQALKPGGTLWFEINEHFGNEISNILKSAGFNNVQIITDWYGKKRVIRGTFG